MPTCTFSTDAFLLLQIFSIVVSHSRISSRWAAYCIRESSFLIHHGVYFDLFVPDDSSTAVVRDSPRGLNTYLNGVYNDRSCNLINGGGD